MKKLLMLFITVVSIYANVNIYGIESYEGLANYRDPVLNRSVSLPTGCMTIHKALQTLERQSGIPILNHSNIADDKVICAISELNKVGDVLDFIVKDKYKTFYINDAGEVVIEEAKEITTTFPNGWDLDETVSLLNKKYPNTYFYTYGVGIKAKTDSKTYQSLLNDLDLLRANAYRYIPMIVVVNDIGGVDTDDVVIVPFSGGKGKEYLLDATHGRVIQTNEVPVPLVFDLQHNSVSLGKKTINFIDIPKFSFSYKGKQIWISILPK